MPKNYYVYIMSSKSRTLYVGVTSDLCKRVHQHKNKLIECFTSKYNISRLVYFEQFSDIKIAIEREKQIKGYNRSKKIELIEKENSVWQDLGLDLFELAN